MKIPNCPLHFCFDFLPKGSSYAVGLFDNLEDAIAASTELASEDMCGCRNPCQRLTKNSKDIDWYEPHERNLDKAGLSYDHFC